MFYIYINRTKRLMKVYYTEYNDWEIQYCYEEAERGNNSYPGCPEYFEIIKVICKGRNIIGLLDYDDLVEKVVKQLEEG